MSSTHQKIVLSAYTAALHVLGTLLPLPAIGRAIAVFVAALIMMHLPNLPLVDQPERGSSPQPSPAPIEPPTP